MQSRTWPGAMTLGSALEKMVFALVFGTGGNEP